VYTAKRSSNLVTADVQFVDNSSIFIIYTLCIFIAIHGFTTWCCLIAGALKVNTGQSEEEPHYFEKIKTWS